MRPHTHIENKCMNEKKEKYIHRRENEGGKINHIKESESRKPPMNVTVVFINVVSNRD